MIHLNPGIGGGITRFAQSKFRVADENLGHDGIVLNPPKSVTKLSMVIMFRFT